MNLPKRLIVVNFKAYRTSTGETAEKLARICEAVTKRTGVLIAVAVQAADIYPVSRAVQIPVFAQHVDPVEYGAHTGSILPEDVAARGAVGTLLNHSEHRIPYRQLANTIRDCRHVPLVTIACAATPAEAVRIARLKPDMIAIEPPDLIGTGISVSTARPGVITSTTRRVKNVPVLCGAGITTGEDVAKAVELGVAGILVASAVTNAKDPKKVLIEFARAFRS